MVQQLINCLLVATSFLRRRRHSLHISRLFQQQAFLIDVADHNFNLRLRKVTSRGGTMYSARKPVHAGRASRLKLSQTRGALAKRRRTPFLSFEMGFLLLLAKAASLAGFNTAMSARSPPNFSGFLLLCHHRALLSLIDDEHAGKQLHIVHFLCGEYTGHTFLALIARSLPWNTGLSYHPAELSAHPDTAVWSCSRQPRHCHDC